MTTPHHHRRRVATSGNSERLTTFGTELRASASARRDSPFQRVATSPLIAEIEAAEDVRPLTIAAAAWLPVAASDRLHAKRRRHDWAATRS